MAPDLSRKITRLYDVACDAKVKATVTGVTKRSCQGPRACRCKSARPASPALPLPTSPTSADVPHRHTFAHRPLTRETHNTFKSSSRNSHVHRLHISRTIRRHGFPATGIYASASTLHFTKNTTAATPSTISTSTSTPITITSTESRLEGRS